MNSLEVILRSIYDEAAEIRRFVEHRATSPHPVMAVVERTVLAGKGRAG